MKTISAIISASAIYSAAAFAPSSQSPLAQTSLKASTPQEFDPLNLSTPEKNIFKATDVAKFAATAAAACALHPLAAVAGTFMNFLCRSFLKFTCCSFVRSFVRMNQSNVSSLHFQT